MSLFKDWFCTRLTSLKKMTIIIGSLFCVTTSYAMNTGNAWQFNIAPYLWATGMSGTEGIGSSRVHINQTFSDIWHDLDWGGMLWLDANKDNLGLFINTMYVVLSKDVTDGPVSADIKNRFGIFSAGASYEVLRRGALAVSPYAGFRYTLNDTAVTLNTPLSSLRATDNQHWTDPILGLKLLYNFTRAWSILLAGDLGGTNANDHYSYNVVGLLGYSPQTIFTNTTAYLGYRLLDQHYETGSGSSAFNWNMKLFGPVLGVSIAF